MALTPERMAELDRYYISKAISAQEWSGKGPAPTSIDGAVGNHQIIPDTFKRYAKPGENIHNADDNKAVHDRIIADLSQKAGGDPARIAVGYFSGDGNIAPPARATPYLKDARDGNGKSVSSYVSDVMGRVGSAPAESVPQSGNPKLSPERIAELDEFYAAKAPVAKTALADDTFLGEMGQNAKNAVQSAKDILSGNVETWGRGQPSPRTEALGDKLFPAGTGGTGVLDATGDFLYNLNRNTSPGDLSGALLEKFGNNPAGKALSVIGGLNPVYNAAGTAINRYVNPAISEATGINPNDLALMELVAGTAGLKGAGKVKDPTVSLAKYAGRKALKAITPRASEGLAEVAQLARDYNIPLSLDQVSGSRALKTAQKVSQDLPFSGQAGFRDTQMKAFNKQILHTVGEKGNIITPEVMDRAFTRVGAEFDKLGAGKTFNINSGFKDTLNTIRSEARTTATKDALGNFDNMVREISKDVAKNGQVSGEKLNNWRIRVNERARKTNNADTSALLHDLENTIVDTMTAGDDVAKGALSGAKKQYKNLLVIEPLAQKAKGGFISPTELQARVSKIYGRQYTRGKAGDIGNLARIGKELLPELGGSDTQSKTTYLGLGYGLGNPVTAAPVAAGLGVNRAMQSFVNRNQSVVDSAIRNAQKAPALSPSAAGKLPPTAGKAGGVLTNAMRKRKP